MTEEKEIEIIIPKDEQEWLGLRTKDITSTEISALFGLSPYMTKFELWHAKKDSTLTKFEENERMKWGTILQDAIALGIAKDQGWELRKMSEYIRIPQLRMGSSFDFSIEGMWPEVGEDKPVGIYELGILEVKNVDGLQFKSGWLVDPETKEIEAPAHIELQVQHQMAVSGRSYAYIAALVGGNTLKLIKRDRDELIIKSIKDAVKAFWSSIEENRQPDPDFKRDAEFISQLFGFAEPGKTIDGSNDEELRSLALQYAVVSTQVKDYEQQKQAIKAQILMLVGTAEKILGGNFTISAGVTGPTIIQAFERKGFRNFRISWKKER